MQRREESLQRYKEISFKLKPYHGLRAKQCKQGFCDKSKLNHWWLQNTSLGNVQSFSDDSISVSSSLEDPVLKQK